MKSLRATVAVLALLPQLAMASTISIKVLVVEAQAAETFCSVVATNAREFALCEHKQNKALAKFWSHLALIVPGEQPNDEVAAKMLRIKECTSVYSFGTFLDYEGAVDCIER